MVIYNFILIFFSFFIFSTEKESIFENIFESKDYVIIYKLSIELEKHKLKIENLIKINKLEKIRRNDLIEIEILLEKIKTKLNEIKKNRDNANIFSQIATILLEIDETKNILKKAKIELSNKKKCEKIIYEIEFYIDRLIVYLKGLSQNLSYL